MIVHVIRSKILCNSFDCELQKNLQFTIIRISQSKPDLWYVLKFFIIVYSVTHLCILTGGGGCRLGGGPPIGGGPEFIGY